MEIASPEAALCPDVNPLSVAERIEWYAHALKIRPKQQPGQRKVTRLIPFVLNKQQQELEEYSVWCYANNIPARLLTLKARQEGISTWTEGHIFLQTRLFSDQQAFIFAHDEDATQNLKEMYVRYWQFLPKENKPELNRSNRRGIEFKDNRSQIYCFTAGKGRGGGRSFNPTHLHASEVDFWPDPERLYDAVSQGIAEEAWTFIMFESTADGPGLMMNNMWDDAVDGRNEFKPFFFAWWRHAEYIRQPSYEDMLRYGPPDWVSRNRNLLERAIERSKDGRLGRHSLAKNGTGSRRGRGTNAAIHKPPGERNAGAPAETSSDQRSEPTGHDRQTLGPWGPAQPLPPVPTFSFTDGRSEHRPGPGRPTDDDPSADHAPAIPGTSATDDRTDHPDRHADRGSEDRPEDRPTIQGDLAARWRASGYSRSDLEPVGADHDGIPSTTILLHDSYTGYELSLVTEFGLQPEQINWLRFIKANKCRGDEVTRRREYPSRPEESFQAATSEVLNLRILADWLNLAKTYPLMKASFRSSEKPSGELIAIPDLKDANGRTEIYEVPNREHRYLAALDAAAGIGEYDMNKLDDEGDWHVCCVIDIETGNQVAEYRSKDDPDLMIDEVEALCAWYKVLELAPETTGGHGVNPMRQLLDRGKIKVHEREVLDRQTREFVKRPGWNTGAKEKGAMLSEMKLAVREQSSILRSSRTIREAMLLQLTPTGTYGAPRGKHDDGPAAWAICLVLRARILGRETLLDEQQRQKSSFIRRLDRLDKSRQPRNTLTGMNLSLPVKRRPIRPAPRRHPYGRRSWG